MNIFSCSLESLWLHSLTKGWFLWLPQKLPWWIYNLVSSFTKMYNIQLHCEHFKVHVLESVNSLKSLHKTNILTAIIQLKVNLVALRVSNVKSCPVLFNNVLLDKKFRSLLYFWQFNRMMRHISIFLNQENDICVNTVSSFFTLIIYRNRSATCMSLTWTL